MSKNNRFGKSIGDVLLEAMANKQDSGHEEGSLLSKKQKQKLTNEIKQTYKASAKTTLPKSDNTNPVHPLEAQSVHRKRVSQPQRFVPENLFYNALKRSPQEIYEEFRCPGTSINKRKGMIEGVTHAYYSLANKGDHSTSNQKKTLEYQDLLAMLKKEIKVPMQAAKPPTKTKPKISSKEAPAPKKANVRDFTTRTQFDSCSEGRGLIDVVIGFDFGTACTKVVIRTPYERDLAYLVPFGEFAHCSNQFLLPTHINSANGVYCFPKTGKISGLSNLKLEYIRSLTRLEEDNAAEYNAIAYLALVFQYVRCWFLRNCGENYSGKSLAWAVNIGVPSATAENEDVCRLYEKAVLVAWTLSIKEQHISAKGVEEVKALYQAGDVSENELVDVKVFPEVAAEVIGYTQSDLRREGLHLMVDIGAGTFDICGFNVHKNDGENVLPIFSTSVEPYGVKSIYQVRCDAISEALKKCHNKLVEDVVAPISQKLDDYLPCEDDFQQEMLKAEETLGKKCSVQLRSVILDLKKKHDPLSNRWKSQLPVFLCGGGRKLPFYQETIKKIADWMKSNINNSGIQIVALPCPDSLADVVDEESFYRFGVAWGLSHSQYDIDRVMTNLMPVQTYTQSVEEHVNWWERPTSYLLQDD